MAYELRPYQKDAVEAVFSEWKEGHKKTFITLATGCGKTIIFSNVIKKIVEKGGRVLVLAHREELLAQAVDKIRSVTGITPALEKAQITSVDSGSPVTAASVQTLQRDKRLNSFPPDSFDAVVVDECHHSLSPSYQKVLNYFGSAYVLGVTATPDRGDKKLLSKYYDSCAYEYGLPEAVKNGYLCPIKAEMIPVKLDISKVGVQNGDFSASETGNALEPYLEPIADAMKEYCDARKTVVFVPLIKIAKKLTKILKKKGIKAVEIDGSSQDRQQILEDFDKGKYSVIVNPLMLNEGWDCPSVDCVVPLRPTKIRSLYAQMVGRGTRLFKGKKDLLVLDFLWLTERHNLCRPSSLISRNDDMASRIDRMIRNESGIYLLDAEAQAERDAVAEREASLAKELERRRSMKKKLVDPLVYAAALSDGRLLDYEPVFAWETEGMTDKQRQTLIKNGIDADEVKTKGRACLIIGTIVERCRKGLSSPKQIRLLESKGFVHVEAWKFEYASQMIDRIAKNGWAVPEGIIPEKVVCTERGLVTGR